ncbi:MAG: hypothetical protein PHG97_00565 [Candidatus Margulisbacteria bacterium]|nr:hypothetical protein [Candidatus Margulisiibacteriota bacterium]
MNIGKPFIDSWNIYIKHLGTILIAFIILIILSVITLGVLYIPLLIGLQMLFVKAKRGEQITANEVLAPINRYFSLVFGSFGIGLLVLFGLLLLIVPGLAWASWWMYAALFMYDRSMHIEDGMKSSKDVVRKSGTWWHLLFLVIVFFIDNVFVWFIGPLGFIAKFVTTPLTMGAVACAYADESK